MLRRAAFFLAAFAIPFLGQVMARNVFVFPTDTVTNAVAVFPGDPFPGTSTSQMTIPLGATPVRALSNTSGTVYYIGTTTGATGGLAIVNASTGALIQNFSYTAPIQAARITPDGGKVIVYSDKLHIYDTTSNTEIPLTLQSVGQIVPDGMVVTLDSSRVFVLIPGAGNTAGQLIALDLSTYQQVGGSVAVPGDSTTINALSIGPNGLLYVSRINAVDEVDPTTLTIRHTFALNAMPGKLLFTPDGKYAVTQNSTPVTGSDIMVLDLSAYTVASSLSFNVVMDKIIVAGNSRIFAYSSAKQTIYDIPLQNLSGIGVATFGGTSFAGGVTAVEISEEPVTPHYLYIDSNNTLYRADIQANVLSGSVALGVANARLGYAGAATSGAPADFLQYNNNQALTSNTTTLPLIVRVVDTVGKPVYNTTVAFNSVGTGITIENANVRTSTDGFASTSLLLPSGGGTYAVTATVNGIAKNFTLTIGSSGGGGGTAGLSILSGNGQVVYQGYPAAEALQVVLTDASGNPIPNAIVSWTIKDGSGSVPPTSTTDINGIAIANYFPSIVVGTYQTSDVVAAYGTSSVDFIVTTLGSISGFGNIQMNVNFQQPVDQNLSGQAGTTQAGALGLQAYTNNPVMALPNVGIKLVPSGDPTAVPSATCAGGTVLTNAAGFGSCDVVFGPRIGSGTVSVVVGSVLTYTFNIQVVAGPPTAFKILQGNNQSGTPGQALPLALTAALTDAAGNVLPGVAVTWASTNGVALSNTQKSTNAVGQVSTLATLGTTPGAATVTVSTSTGITATFKLNVNVQLGGFTLVSGSNQTQVVNQPFGSPLTVKVLDAQNNPVSNMTVAFTVTSGSASLSAASATTDATGAASVTATAGAIAGPVVVSATLQSLTPVTFNLTVIPPGPVFTAANVLNAASGAAGVVPGSIATIYGSGFAPNISNGSVIANNGFPWPWPVTLAGVQVQFGSYTAPIYAVNNVNGQQSISVQVPYEVPLGTTSVTVSISGGSTTVQGVHVYSLQPGIFEAVTTSGSRYAILIRPNGTMVSSTNPTVRGENLRMFVTGLGQVSPVTATDALGSEDMPQYVNAPVVVGVRDSGVPVSETIYAPNTIGIYIVTFQVPQTAPTGSNVKLSMGAVGTDNSVAYSQNSVIPAIQ